MSIIPSTDSEVSPYVRTDVSTGVLLALGGGVVSGLLIHWTFFVLMTAIASMAIGVSTVYEWNKGFVSEGVAPKAPFTNVRAAAFVPAGMLLVAFHFQGHPFIVSGGLSLLIFIGYLYTLYAVGFRTVDSETVQFEPDPYSGEEKVWTEDVYIPLLEQWAVEQSADTER